VPPTQRTNSMAIIALICSIGGLVTIISAPVGIVLGHIAKQIAETGEEGGALLRRRADRRLCPDRTGASAVCCGVGILTITAIAQSN
jgi:hypothetical protein